MSIEESLLNAHDADMNDDLANIQFQPVWNYNYARYFQDVPYNGKTLYGIERERFISFLNNTIAQYCEGIPLMRDTLEKTKHLQDEYHELEKSVVSIMFFVLITMIDSLVATKYFLLADTDYDRRFMRGKLMVVLNEGFKRLYGFGKKIRDKDQKPEWSKVEPLMRYFPETVQEQFQELNRLLGSYAQSSSWWKNERVYEVHLQIENLYASRQEEINESKVMMDMMKLFKALLAVNDFMSNLHTCLYNFLVRKYKRGELKDE